MKKTLIFAVSIMIAFSACTGKKKNLLAPELAAKAMTAFEKKRYSQSIETFEKLLDWYPFDKLATLAEFKIAESHFKMKEYDEAVIYYKDFIKLHPRNEAVPYVMFQIAQCYYKRVDTVDRDQNNARFALIELRMIIRKFPDSEYAKQSKALIKKCLESIAGHEVYVGSFYYKSKHYKAALNRFKGIVANYPGLGFDEEATKYVAMCNEKIAEEEAAGGKEEKKFLGLF